MSYLFPSLYERRLKESASAAESPVAGKKGSRTLNMLLYLTVGSYVSLRAWILNRKYAKEGNVDDIFATKIGPDRLEYVSRSYAELGKMYQPLQKR